MAALGHGFRLAHLSDLHIGPLPKVTPGMLFSKRALGYLSWRVRKQRVHRAEVLAALREDLRASAPDHIAITGDLVNLALPAEFVRAAQWLRELGPPERISVVPGNHEAYAAVRSADSLAHWADYMSSDKSAGPPNDVGFPYLRRRGPLALIGLSSASVSPPGFATGRLGGAQLQALERLLATLNGTDCYRILLLHHPPLNAAGSWRKRLIDAAGLRKIIATRGAELVLHGHEHAPSRGSLNGQNGTLPALGVPSGSSLDARPERQAQYQIHTIVRAADGWRLHSEIRRYDSATSSFAAPLP
jgi:3',5'-cyclic AMP phosphodiesterase CpdA